MYYVSSIHSFNSYHLINQLINLSINKHNPYFKYSIYSIHPSIYLFTHPTHHESQSQSSSSPSLFLAFPNLQTQIQLTTIYIYLHLHNLSPTHHHIIYPSTLYIHLHLHLYPISYILYPISTPNIPVHGMRSQK